MFLIFLAAVIIFVWVYILWVREWLVLHWPDTFLKWHLVEDKLWENSRTLLVSRLYWIGGILVAIHELLVSAGFDWTPILTEIGKYLPERMRPLALAGFLALTGIAFEWLRHKTTESVAEKRSKVI